MGNDLKLDQIKADIIQNNVCPDLAQGATQLVMSHGNPEKEGDLVDVKLVAIDDKGRLQLSMKEVLREQG